MADSPFTESLAHVRSTFDRSTSCLEEEDSGFIPVEGMFSTAQHVAHTAHTVDWFLEGAFRAEGFDLDFEAQEERVRGVTSMSDARRWWGEAMDRALKVFRETPEEDLGAPIAEGPILGGAPRFTIVEGIADHTAHHRGALTIYARLRGRTPEMPYA